MRDGMQLVAGMQVRPMVHTEVLAKAEIICFAWFGIILAKVGSTPPKHS
jgi:hypothetical protein